LNNKEKEMGGTCSKYEKEEESYVLAKNLEGKRLLGRITK
jgi:hypothetical protein